MHQKKSKKIIFYFFLLIVFGSINNKIFSKTKFYQIKEIQITGLENIDNQILLSKFPKTKGISFICFLDLINLPLEPIKKF